MYNIFTAGHTLREDLGKSSKFIDDEIVVVSATPNRIQQTILEKIELKRKSFKDMGMVMEETKTDVVILSANLNSIKSPNEDITPKNCIKYLGYYICSKQIHIEKCFGIVVLSPIVLRPSWKKHCYDWVL